VHICEDVSSTFPPKSKILTDADHGVVTTLKRGSENGAMEAKRVSCMLNKGSHAARAKVEG
jgi:hypothetical protein